MPADPALSSNLSVRHLLLPMLVFLSILFGVFWQGIEFFWFGIASACCFLLLLFHIHASYRQTIDLPKSPALLIALLLVAWCFLTVFWSEVRFVSLVRAITISMFLVGCYSYFFLTHSALSWERLWQTVIAVGVVLFFISLVDLYRGEQVNSLFLNPNLHAAYLNLIILPSAAYFLLADQRRTRLLLGTALFVLIFSQMLQGGRGASLGQFIGLLMILIAGFPGFDYSRVRQFLLIYLAAIISATLATSRFFRVVDPGTYSGFVAGESPRWVIWESSLDLLKASPWHGNGVGSYWLNYPQFRHYSDHTWGQNAHNDYLQILIEAGIPGLLLILLMICSITYIWWRHVRSRETSHAGKVEASGLAGGIAAIGSHAFVSATLDSFSILFLCGLLFGRFLHVTEQTRPVNVFARLPLQRKAFSVSMLIVSIIVLAHFTLISANSYYLMSARQASERGQFAEARQLSGIAIGLLSYVDRPHLLNSWIYLHILENSPNLGEQKRQLFFHKAMTSNRRAEELNPFRPQTYFVRGRLIEVYSKSGNEQARREVEALYLRSLQIDPRFLLTVRYLTEFYLSAGRSDDALATVGEAARYWHQADLSLYNFYRYALSVVARHGSAQQRLEIEQKLRQLRENFEARGIKFTEQPAELEQAQ